MSTHTATETVAVDPADGLADYYYPDVYRQLLGYVAKHRMEVLHEDGLYRHVRFATPGTSIGSFDLVTWPGHLTISGDIGGGWTFRREADMFTWFVDYYRGRLMAAGHINPGYWAEKVLGRRDHRGFSEAKFTADVNQRIDETVTRHGLGEEEAAELAEAAQNDLLDRAHYFDTNSAYDAVTSFRPEVLDAGGPWTRPFADADPENWDDFDHHYLLACHAILWGVRTYITETR